jgi:DUF917 family protein
MAKIVFRPEQTEALLAGVGVLGTGGGGQVEFGRVILENDFRRGRAAELVGVEDISDDAFVVSGGILGSVKAIAEKGFDGVVRDWEQRFDLLDATRSVERYFGRKVDYVVPFELGGLNTAVIMSLAARLGVPMLDADLLGRAAPETQMTSLIGLGVSLYPMVMLDGEGTTCFVERAESIFFADQLGRWMVQQAKGMGANNHYPMDGATARRAVIPGTVTGAVRLGERLLQAQTAGEDGVEAIRAHLGAYLLGRGKVSDVVEEERGAFFHKRATIESGRGRIELTVKNEYMLARLGGRIVTVFPDFILALEPGTGRGLMSLDLKPGREVAVLVAPCHSRLRQALQSSTGRAAFAGNRYGEDGVEYTPVEQLLPEAGFAGRRGGGGR